MAHSALDISSDERPLDKGSILIYRALLALAAVGSPLFWGLDRLSGHTYDDPFEYRVCLSALGIAILVFSYASKRFERHLRSVTNAFIVMAGLFYGWTAAKNGIDATWSAGLLLVSVMGGLSITFITRRVTEMAWPLVALGAAIVVPSLVVGPPPGGYGYTTLQLSAAVALCLAFA